MLFLKMRPGRNTGSRAVEGREIPVSPSEVDPLARKVKYNELNSKRCFPTFSKFCLLLFHGKLDGALSKK
jgi:hypothetical protein